MSATYTARERREGGREGGRGRELRRVGGGREGGRREKEGGW